MKDIFSIFKKMLERLRGKKEPEKIRIRIRDGKIVSVYFPAHLVGDVRKFAALSQQVHCYEIKLNGNGLKRGLF